MLTNILRLFLGRNLKPFVFEGIQKNQKEQLNYNQKNTGIYIHIPFCKKLCSFCPYNKVKYDENLMNKYIDALLNEIDNIAKQISTKREITSVYFGGGSPALAGKRLIEITSKIKEHFDVKGNTGIELHPNNINDELLDELERAGFDMVSIGIQSFQNKCLNSLNREIIETQSLIKQVKSRNFKAIDIDLIFGIPKQTKDDLENDFLTAVECGATQISTYPFIDFSYANNKNKPLGLFAKKQMLEKLIKTSQKAGFERNSIWTFIKKDTPRYSSITRDNFIGFGSSATTLTKECFKINTFSIEEYIKKVNKNESATALTLNFTKRTRALYWMFWSCYNMVLDKYNFKELFDENLDDFFKYELFLAKKLKIIKEIKEGYKLTDFGAFLFHIAEQKYTHQYIDKTWNIAGKNPWPENIILY